MTLPDLYFRLRENGAAVFRVEAENRQGRLDLEPLAFANVRTGEIRVQGTRVLTDAEEGAITDWIAARQRELQAREAGEVALTIEAINKTAHWAQTKASDAEIAAGASGLFLAMHDLRSVLVRRQAEAED